jgi:gluconate 5-dehydrogenase
MSYFSDLTLDLTGRNIAIFGASGHLGSALTLGMVESGATVLAVARDEEKLADLKNRAIEMTGELIYAVSDIHDYSNIQRVVEEFQGEFGPISGCVNNAHQSIGSPKFLNSDPEDVSNSLKYLASVIMNTQYIGQQMILTKTAGSIVNISSMYALVSPKPYIYEGMPEFGNPPVYGAIKAGINQFTRYAAVHLAPSKIRVNSISPGAFPSQTDNNKNFISRLEKEIPLGRIGIPQELVGGLIFLLSNSSNYITGTNLVIDGGWTAW